MIEKLGDIASYVNGFAFKPSEWAEEGLPIIRIQDLTGTSSNPNYYNKPYDKKYEINKGDVLISWSASLGVYIWCGEKALLNQHIFKVIFDKKDINKDFFVYQVSHILKKASEQAHGATMRHLTRPVFNSLSFWLPERNIQNKIADTLNLLSKLIVAKEKQVKELDKLIKSRFVEMFGDPVLNLRNYPVHHLHDYIEHITSGSRGWAKYCNKNGKEWFITIKNVKNCHIDVSNIQAINAPNNAESLRTRVRKGDLLISITADLGRTGVVTEEIAKHGAYINQHLTCVRLNTEKIEPLYVAYFLESAAGKKQFFSKNQNAVKAGLNFNAIETLQIYVPSIDNQRKFILFVHQVDKSKLAVQKSLEELETLKNSLMQQYFD